MADVHPDVIKKLLGLVQNSLQCCSLSSMMELGILKAARNLGRDWSDLDETLGKGRASLSNSCILKTALMDLKVTPRHLFKMSLRPAQNHGWLPFTRFKNCAYWPERALWCMFTFCRCLLFAYHRFKGRLYHRTCKTCFSFCCFVSPFCHDFFGSDKLRVINLFIKSLKLIPCSAKQHCSSWPELSSQQIKNQRVFHVIHRHRFRP